MTREEQVEKTIGQIIKKVQDFTLDELLELRFDLEARIEELRESKDSAASQGVEKEAIRTVREEWKRCGKPSCKCKTGEELHGPYVYEYWKEEGRTRSRYIGKAK